MRRNHRMIDHEPRHAAERLGEAVRELPLDAIHTFLLVRDRMPGEDEELDSLVTSIREIGLSNPIRVMPRQTEPGYELVQGFRRLSAYRRIGAETGEARWRAIPALVVPAGTDIPGLYRWMVDENTVRKDLSFAEMAHAARTYAADPATGAADVGAAVSALFQSAPYSKRSCIRAFAALLDEIGPALAYPAEIPRELGVRLAREIRDRPEIADRIHLEFEDWEGRSIADELRVLREAVESAEGEPGPGAALPGPAARGRRRVSPGARVTFDIRSRAGSVTCTAGPGRLEIRAERDFSTVERLRLERAIAALVDGLR